MVAAVTTLLAAGAAPAGAMFAPDLAAGAGTAGDSTDTVTGGAPGIGTTITGLLPPDDVPFDPLAGYPATNPAGYEAISGFAGLIATAPVAGQATALMYCIDIRDQTADGIGYELSTWNATRHPFLGFIARVVAGAFPNHPASPPGLATDAQRATAAQEAIWFFSDGFVVPAGAALRSEVSDIVAAALAAGPLAAPRPPSLRILPSSARRPAGGTAGPFTLVGDGPAAISVSGGTLSADARGASPIANGTTLRPGATFFVRSTALASAAITATGAATIPFANVYAYDDDSGPPPRQELILAQTARIRMQARVPALVDGRPRLPATGAPRGA